MALMMTEAECEVLNEYAMGAYYLRMLLRLEGMKMLKVPEWVR